VPNGVWLLQLRGNKTTMHHANPVFPRAQHPDAFARIETEDQIHESVKAHFGKGPSLPQDSLDFTGKKGHLLTLSRGEYPKMKKHPRGLCMTRLA